MILVFLQQNGVIMQNLILVAAFWEFTIMMNLAENSLIWRIIQPFIMPLTSVMQLIDT